MKTIVLKQNGKKIYQFKVQDAALSLAERLGISEQQYITELAKAHLTEKKRKKE
jgi:hypothetical protein